MTDLGAPEALLEVRGLKTHLFSEEGIVRAVDGVDLEIRPGTTLCLVGESGCGKSMTARSILQIVPAPGRIVAGEVLLRRPGGEVVDLAALEPRGRAIRRVRGRDIAMVFQEPMTSLSPVHTIGSQIVEAIELHFRVGAPEAKRRAVEVLGRVGFARPERQLGAYSFQLSGGMRQRAMIAMALSCRPGLLIADEPTTALDVTTQANILDLLRDLQQELGMAVLFITHDLGVVAEIADDVAVMYLGRVVERGSVDDVFHAAKHPYTRALLHSIPAMGGGGRGQLATIRGSVPHPFHVPAGCPFHPRCDHAVPGTCDVVEPAAGRVGPGHEARCLLYEDPWRRSVAADPTAPARPPAAARPDGSAPP